MLGHSSIAITLDTYSHVIPGLGENAAYAMLNLKVVCHKDRSLEVSWGANCSEWLEHE